MSNQYAQNEGWSFTPRFVINSEPLARTLQPIGVSQPGYGPGGFTDPSGSVKIPLEMVGGAIGNLLPGKTQIPQNEAPAQSEPSPTWGGLQWTAISGHPNLWNANAGGGMFYYTGPDHKLYLDSYAGEVHPGDLGNVISQNVSSFFGGSNAGNPPPPQNTNPGSGGTQQGNSGGAGLSGNGPLIDALTALLGGGGGQSPLDASSSPSTAALQALQPSSGQTSGTSNPALIIAIVGALAIGAWLYFKHKHGAAPPK